jgi:hypothetical protein
MLILIDNYDSFTYNLVHYLGEPCEVYRNDKISADEVLAAKPQAIVLSPGPCMPNVRSSSPRLALAKREFPSETEGRFERREKLKAMQPTSTATAPRQLAHSFLEYRGRWASRKA